MELKISPYTRIGEENIKKLIHGFYKELRNDTLLRPMYKEKLEEAEERLYLFMIQYLGGPKRYNDLRGLPRLKKRHQLFAIDEDAKDSWLRNMKTALDKSNIIDDDKEFLWDYFAKTANFMKNK
jgi:hemoglobin